jgi:hypothetical protein
MPRRMLDVFRAVDMEHGFRKWSKKRWGLFDRFVEVKFDGGSGKRNSRKLGKELEEKGCWAKTWTPSNDCRLQSTVQ